MGTIESINETVRRVMQEGTDAIAPRVRSVTYPIYGEKGSGKPEFIGSCLLLSIGCRRLLLTAAHVADARKHSALYFEANRRFIAISGELTATEPPSGNRDDDHCDFAVFELASEADAQLGELSYLLVSEIDPNDYYVKGALYLALGYPASRNSKVNPTTRKVSPKRISVTTNALPPEEHAEFGVRQESHIILRYDRNNVREGDDSRIVGIHPRGFSGGGVWRIGCFGDAEALANPTYGGKLVGVLIEYDESRHVMVAVRLSLVQGAILNRYPELRPYFSEAMRIKVNVTVKA